MANDRHLIDAKQFEYTMGELKKNMGGASGGVPQDLLDKVAQLENQLGGLTFKKEDGLIQVKDPSSSQFDTLHTVPSDKFIVTSGNSYDLVYDPLGIWRRTNEQLVPGEDNNWEVNLAVWESLTAVYDTEFGLIADYPYSTMFKIYMQCDLSGIQIGYNNVSVIPGGGAGDIGLIKGIGSDVRVPIYGGEIGSNYATGQNNMSPSSILSIARLYPGPSTLEVGTKYILCFRFYPSKYKNLTGWARYTFQKLTAVQ